MDRDERTNRIISVLSREYDVRVNDLGKHRFRVTLGDEGSRRQLASYKTMLEHHKMLDKFDSADRTTAAACMLVNESLLTIAEKPVDSYVPAEPPLQTTQTTVEDDRTFEIVLDNASAREIIDYCTKTLRTTEERMLTTTIAITLATHAILGEEHGPAAR